MIKDDYSSLWSFEWRSIKKSTKSLRVPWRASSSFSLLITRANLIIVSVGGAFAAGRKQRRFDPLSTSQDGFLSFSPARIQKERPLPPPLTKHTRACPREQLRHLRENFSVSLAAAWIYILYIYIYTCAWPTFLRFSESGAISASDAAKVSSRLTTEAWDCMRKVSIMRVVFYWWWSDPKVLSLSTLIFIRAACAKLVAAVRTPPMAHRGTPLLEKRA